MITIEEFSSLDEGDQFDAGPLLSGLDPDAPISLICMSVKTEPVKTFNATYQGVSLGVWRAFVKEGAVTWQTA